MINTKAIIKITYLPMALFNLPGTFFVVGGTRVGASTPTNSIFNGFPSS